MSLQEIVFGVVGIILVLAVIADVLTTTLRLNGSGFLSVSITNRLWYLVLQSRLISSNHSLLSLLGFSIVLLSILLWLVLLWLGWVLFFFAYDGAVINTQTGFPADFWSRAYFVGYTLTTLGPGDYRPEGTVWKVATVLASANGFFFITLIAAYLLPLIAAVGAKRQFAAYVTSLGTTPEEMVVRAWTGSGFGSLSQHLDEFSPLLTSLAQQHLSYPVIHCFHDQDRTTASAPGIAALSEALLLLRYGVAPEQRPDAVTLRVLEGTLVNFLNTLDSAFIEPDPHVPPIPDLDVLRRHGIPTVDNQTFEQACDGLEKRRCLLLAQVKRDGWSWSDVTGDASDLTMTHKR
jgi:hypothetical protein